MALVIKDRVRETSTTTGTGTLTLAGAVSGFQDFSAIGDGNTTYYAIVHQSAAEWEVGLGTYTASGTTLARTNVLASSNAGAAVNLSSGTKDVFVTLPATGSAARAAIGAAQGTGATGFVPIPLLSGSAEDAAVGNLWYEGSIPDLADISSIRVLRWVANDTTPIFYQIALPPDLDDASNVEIHIRARMSNTNNTPTMGIATRWNEGAEVSDATGAITGTSFAEYTATVAAADVPSGAQNVQIKMTPGAHAADQLILVAVWIEYTKL